MKAFSILYIFFLLISNNLYSQWEDANGELIGGYIEGFALTPKDYCQNNIYGFGFCGTPGVVKSIDNGKNWLPVESLINKGNYYSIASSGNSVFVSTYSGKIFYTTNDGESWDLLSFTANETSKLGRMGDDILALGKDNLYLLTNQNGIIKAESLGLYKIFMDYLYINDFLFASSSLKIYRTKGKSKKWDVVDSSRYIYSLAKIGNSVLGGGDNGIWKSTDYGDTWKKVKNGIGPKLGVKCLEANDKYVFCGTHGDGVYISKDSGETWTQMNEGLPDHAILSLKISKNILFAGTQAGIYKYKLDSINCDCNLVSYPNFEKTENLVLNGSAKKTYDYIRLTENQFNESASLWYKDKLDFSKGFTSRFSFRFSGERPNPADADSCADGLAFVMQKTSPDALGDNGGGLGYEGIENGIAIEFDTYANDLNEIINKNDSNDNHVAVIVCENNRLSSCHNAQNTLGLNKEIMKIKSDSSIYYAGIDYLGDKGLLNIYLDTIPDLKNPVLTIQDFNLSKLISSPDNLAFFGFTSSTGSSREIHDLISWRHCLNYYEDDVKADEDYAKTIYSFSFPNPSNNIVTIKYQLKTNSNSDYKIYFLDILGNKHQLVYKLNEYDSYVDIVIDVNSLSPGLYFCVLIVNEIGAVQNFIVK